MWIRRFSLGLAALGASAIIAGCGAASLGPVSEPGAESLVTISPAKAAPAYAYTCQSATNFDCLVFKGYFKNTKLVRTLMKSLKAPVGVVAGSDGLFYAADKSAKDVIVYSAGGAKILATLSDGGNVPVDVAVYNGELAVANQKNVTVFTKGAQKPTRTLTASGVVAGSGTAFDSKGNCYFSFSTSSGASVDEFKACNGKPQALSISPGSPYGIAFDGKGNLWYTSYAAAGPGVYECSGVTSCAQVYKALNFINPQYLNFSKGFTDLWIDDPANYQCYCTGLYEIDVATGKEVGRIISDMSFFDPPTGVAVAPGPL